MQMYKTFHDIIDAGLKNDSEHWWNYTSVDLKQSLEAQTHFLGRKVKFENISLELQYIFAVRIKGNIEFQNDDDSVPNILDNEKIMTDPLSDSNNTRNISGIKAFYAYFQWEPYDNVPFFNILFGIFNPFGRNDTLLRILINGDPKQDQIDSPPPSPMDGMESRMKPGRSLCLHAGCPFGAKGSILLNKLSKLCIFYSY